MIKERFSYEWTKYPAILPEHESQFRSWTYPLKPGDFKNKLVLDAGCGTGRNSFWPLIYEAKKVVSFDHDAKIVSLARSNLVSFKNSLVRFGDIYNIREKNYFDIAFSIGVIHHLKDPRLAVKQLVDATKPGGTILIWVYGAEGNEWISKFVSPLRKITSRLPPALLNLLCYPLTVTLYLFLHLTKPNHHYLHNLSSFRFSHLQSIIFDQFLPPIANYWTRVEVLRLFKNLKVRQLNAYQVNTNSWTVTGIKK